MSTRLPLLVTVGLFLVAVIILGDAAGWVEITLLAALATEGFLSWRRRHGDGARW